MSFYAYVKQPDDEVCVWHYMDLARYMLLLEQRALFFEQVDAVDCQFEGYGTIGNVAPGTNIHDAARETTEFSALSRASLVVSCWHMGDCESAALWQLHADAPVAIKSTVQRLKRGLNYSLLKYVKIGAVNYQPPAILSTEAGVSIEVDYFFKRQSFAHEREVRILAHARDLDLVTRNGGLLASADLGALVEQVCVSPKAPPWFADLVRSITNSTYHVDVEVAQSTLRREALA
jgi:hypothetical protein